MPDDRDIRRRRTPHAGVRAQLAPESWDEDETPPPGPPPSNPEIARVQQLTKIDRRVKVTARTSLAILELASELRREFDQRLDGFAAELAAQRELGARNEGKLDILVSAFEAERRSRERFDAAAEASLRAGVEVTRTRALTAIEVERTDAVAAIDERKAAQAHRRHLVLKILAAVGAVWGLVTTIALAKCGIH